MSMPTNAPSTPAPIGPLRIGGGDLVALVAAMLVAFFIAAAGISLIAGGSDPVKAPTTSDYQAYGGDAYTGIQNAVVDTTSAVVASENAQLAAADRIQHGIGFLMLGAGLVVATLSYQRFVGVRIRS